MATVQMHCGKLLRRSPPHKIQAKTSPGAEIRVIDYGQCDYAVQQLESAISLPSPEVGDMPFEYDIGPITVLLPLPTIPPCLNPSLCLPSHSSHESSQLTNPPFLPFQIYGMISPHTLNFRTIVTVSGICLGLFRGNSRERQEIYINLRTAKGNVKLFFRRGRELWAGVEMEVFMAGNFICTEKLLDIEVVPDVAVVQH